jgi:hypothetical protein
MTYYAATFTYDSIAPNPDDLRWRDSGKNKIFNFGIPGNPDSIVFLRF